VLVGEVSLEELWRMVDRIRVGRQGFALVVAEGGQLIAHGDPDQKPRIAAGENLSDHELVVAAALQSEGAEAGANTLSEPHALVRETEDANGRRLLTVAAAVPALNWTVIVEQPASEAYRLLDQLQTQLIAVIVASLLLTIVFAYYWGRSFIRPILALTRGTEAIAGGHLEERVAIRGTDELHQLGESFNSMAARLDQLQEDVRR
jgi:adenylate cyclase